MIHQTILPFKTEITDETLTPHAGLALFGEFIKGLGLCNLVDEYMPRPGSNAGFKASTYFYPFLLMLHGGGRSLEDIREI